MPDVALVTGAARGIGYAVARRLADDGWSVMLSDQTDAVHAAATKLAKDTGQGGIRSVRCDVRSETEVDELVAVTVHQLGGLDLVVVNAGIGGGSVHLADLSADEFDSVIAVNLRGSFLTVRAAARFMRQQRRGSIVTIGSVYGRVPVPGVAAYSASKAAVVALTKTTALELGPYGIRVNAIAPGYIATPMRWDALQSRAEQFGVDPDELYAEDVASVPLRRYGTGADVAGSVVFLAGKDAGYITGHVIDLNGGLSLR